MKTKTEKTTKKIPSTKRSGNRGLNSDEQTRIINVPDEEDIDDGADRILPQEDRAAEEEGDVEQEEEREKKRRVEDARGEQEN